MIIDDRLSRLILAFLVVCCIPISSRAEFTCSTQDWKKKKISSKILDEEGLKLRITSNTQCNVFLASDPVPQTLQQIEKYAIERCDTIERVGAKLKCKSGAREKILVAAELKRKRDNRVKEWETDVCKIAALIQKHIHLRVDHVDYLVRPVNSSSFHCQVSSLEADLGLCDSIELRENDLVCQFVGHADLKLNRHTIKETLNKDAVYDNIEAINLCSFVGSDIGSRKEFRHGSMTVSLQKAERNQCQIQGYELKLCPTVNATMAGIYCGETKLISNKISNWKDFVSSLFPDKIKKIQLKRMVEFYNVELRGKIDQLPLASELDSEYCGETETSVQ